VRWRTEPPGQEAYRGDHRVANRFKHTIRSVNPLTHVKGHLMNNIIYIVGAVVIIAAILSFLGLR
jgi:ABC-type dipeptide/oligopeptide/nickel transport system permease subunit